ncbi:MAG: DNA polymerase III subunit epsilon [Betaproteobacteria bacterium]|nr:DNA polymerase III subunit epsilon [Betaproteobacteria bacterium]
MRQIFLDTETTGLDPAQGHRIIEIACVEMAGRRLTRNNFYKRIHPQRDIDQGAVEVHGITLESLEDAPKFAEVADEFCAFVRGAEVIIHNAPFDIGFLDAELARLGPTRMRDLCKVTDTLAMAREMHPGKKNSLDALCDRYQVDRRARTFHGALMDAELLSEVYLAMTRGQDSLAISLERSVGPAAGTAATSRPQALKVLRATETERAAHAEVLAHLDQASGGKAVWRRVEGASG